MSIARKLRSRTGAFVHDLLVIPVAWLGAYWLRFNLSDIPEEFLIAAVSVLPVVIVIQGSVFWYLGLYRGLWRFASMPDLVRILQAAVLGISLSAVAVFLFNRMQGVPRTVFPLFGVLLILMLGAPRLIYRWFKERRLYDAAKKKVLIVGAGQAGEMLARELLRDREADYYPVAFIDDDPGKRGWDIHGVRVLCNCERIPRVVQEFGIELILLAVPSATSRQMRRLVGICESTGAPFRTLPRIQDLVTGRSALKELRDVSIEDLLGREPVRLDWASINQSMSGKIVVVTGGGGSIGSELCRQIARLAPAALHVFDHSEFNLYSIDLELQAACPELTRHMHLLDVSDRDAVTHLVGEIRPNVIFHAAAYKHVPILEFQVREAVKNNVLGTENLAQAAARHHTESFVLISTDKAVNPTNVMGASKRVAEILCQSMNRMYPRTRFITVRFGNVLDSAGSVVPLFRKQIAAGGPVTVTDPEVKRYFMTIPEACQLIMEAAAVGAGGEVFVLDMGEPIRIKYLAEQMIVLAGRTPGDDVEIVYTGLRPGEKLFEELFHDQESLSATGNSKLLLAHHREVDRAVLKASVAELRTACGDYDVPAIRSILQRLVPEYQRSTAQVQDNVIRLQQARS